MSIKKYKLTFPLTPADAHFESFIAYLKHVNEQKEISLIKIE